ncbi:nitric oxide reductase transcriptional regulator NorR [Pseudenhygromyxa sp. WMMC2535]|uniref:nitric oxide reductase transcriptional regulator NorR n=1 Tax=Pseudenhygromyxa sp. WMMC2535 TaxID=2712867 RepID=UPI0015955953|nr:nitric oxide reductase transcriptional regulator NorR [Pseudenhygromyxa sp. WMMC2535]NVB42748.1 nitric oxide reductase transcriptional regulator NorR [Pseudenhygromyxa sp. WMMC2535]
MAAQTRRASHPEAAEVGPTTAAVVDPTTAGGRGDHAPAGLSCAACLVQAHPMTALGLEALLRGARALCRPGGGERVREVLDELRRATGADASVLLRAHGPSLRPQAASGLLPAALDEPDQARAQPRLTALLAGDGPLIFADDDPRPDPWDGLLADAPSGQIHSCMGCALRFEGRELGVLTLDALTPGRFDERLLAPIAAFSAILSLALQADPDALVPAPRPAPPGRAPRPGALVGRSEVFAALLREVELVAPTHLPVLILGETGTGKERIAEHLHARSQRRDGPLIRLNCATLPSTLAEAELFGHVPGAFTGARRSRRGAFELAEGGSLLLDEIGELPLELQAKLLRVLQSGELWPLGAEQPKLVDVRVLAATHRDLGAEVEAGRFRADLFHRLAGYSLHVPPLRERGADVLALAEDILTRVAPLLPSARPIRLGAAAQAELLARPWPGNVRELEHALTRAGLLAGADAREGVAIIEAAHLGGSLAARAVAAPSPLLSPSPLSPSSLSPSPAPPIGHPRDDADVLPTDLNAAVDDYRRHLILRALGQSQGNWAEAARRLGVDRSNLHRLGRRLGLR